MQKCNTYGYYYNKWLFLLKFAKKTLNKTMFIINN